MNHQSYFNYAGQDKIRELSSPSSYPSSPGAFSQILLDTPGDLSQIYDEDNDIVTNVLSLRSPSLPPIPIEPCLYVR